MAISDALKQAMEADPNIAKALAEGYKLKDCQNGRNAARRMGARVMVARFRHGPRSPQVAAAIAEANRVSVMLTTARAAYNRLAHPEWYGVPPPPEKANKAVVTAPVSKATETLERPVAWRPVWSKTPYAKYRELQNIPNHWEMRKVVLIHFSDDNLRLRVFSLQRNGYQTIALMELAGSGDLTELNYREGRYDFALTREQYNKAAGV